MYFLPSLHHDHVSGHRNSSAKAPPDTQLHSDLARRRGGIITVSRKVLESSIPPKTNVVTKFLLNVNIRGSFGPVYVLISLEDTVGDLIKAAIEIYLKEKRRPLLSQTDACCFNLHYSQFSMESLKPEEKLTNLGSRNFYMCPKPNNNSKSITPNSSRNNEANSRFPFPKFMDFLL